MARLPRLALAGHVHHIIQRGNGDQRIVRDDQDCQRWLDLLAECAQAHGVAVHAYVLLPDGVQILASPDSAPGVPALIQALGRRYVRYFNDRHQRRGTLWEGRYRATVIDPQAYLLPVMASMDWAAVQAGLAAQPKDYGWSSYRHYAGIESSRLVKPHPLIWELGNTPFAREAAYVERVGEGLGEAERAAIEGAALQGWALGDAEFVASLQKETDRRLAKNHPGRPRRTASI